MSDGYVNVYMITHIIFAMPAARHPESVATTDVSQPREIVSLIPTLELDEPHSHVEDSASLHCAVVSYVKR